MFTGIVQGLGTIVAIDRASSDFLSYTVELPKHLAENLNIGASIANNGCCLTIVAIEENKVRFDLMAETLAKTNLSTLSIGDQINIERAVRFGDEIGGHVMSGHVMAQIDIVQIETNEHNHTVWFDLPPALSAYVFPKGFIGLDGCSLTIGTVLDHKFSVHLIPETLEKTLFGRRQVGDKVNVEIDAQTQAVVDTVQRLLNQATK